VTGIRHDLALVAAHSSRLLETCAGLDDAGSREPSLCEGWTRGHVLTHLARNAEAIGRLTAWALTGTAQEMYPGGTDARDAAIAAGAGRPIHALTDDVSTTAAALAPELQRLAREPLAVDEVQMRGGFRVRSATLPFLRLREVVYHHVDLDAGFGFADVEPDLVVRFIDDAVSRLRMSRHAPAVELTADDGTSWIVGEPTAHVTGSAAGILLWLARRRTEGVHSDTELPSLPRGA
jgi:maleylpyruvate isomerase